MGCLALAAAGLLCLCQAAAAVEFHVDPGGDDRNPGTRERPFRTLPRARDAVREVNRDLSADAVVHLAAGVYRLDAPLDLTERDSGSNGHSVVYRSRDGIGAACLSGARPLAGWTRHRGDAWRIRVPKGRVFHTLYEGGKRARKARHPNYIHDPRFPAARAPYFTSEEGSPLGEKGNHTSWITCRQGDVDLAGLEPGALRIDIFPWGKCDWHQWICAVTRLDPATRRLEFDNLGDVTQILGNARYFLEDHPSFLDAPGEFYLDAAESTLYYLPMGKGHPDGLGITMPVTHDVVRIAGASADHPAHHIVFEGLVLEETDALSPTLHWWTREWGKKDHALVWMTDASGITLRHCHLKNSGRSGVVMLGRCEGNRVSGCWIEQMGVNGVTLCDRFPVPSEQAPAPVRLGGNVVTNCRFHDLGQLSLYAAGVELLNVSGSEISHCEFFNSARYAVTLRGNIRHQYGPTESDPRLPPTAGNTMRFLRIFDCCQDSGDTGALHEAAVNTAGKGFVNTFEQITVANTGAVPGMNDIAPDGIFLDWPDRSMDQVFTDVQIVGSQGRALRSNGAGNGDSARTDNVSWRGTFDERRMRYEEIGLLPDFPKEFGGRGPAYQPPPAPGDLRATAVDHATVALTWAPPAGAGEAPLAYTVFRDGAPIATVEEPRCTDLGLAERATYRYRVAARRGPVGPRGPSGPEVTVRTPEDRVPPTVQGVGSSSDLRRVTVVFSKPVEPESAGSPVNYALDPAVGVARAEVLEDRRTVSLAVAQPLATDTAYTLTVRGVRDASVARNPVATAAAVTFRPARLVVHYRMDAGDGTAVVDSSGSGLHGTLEGAGRWQPAGSRPGGALELDGHSAWARCPSDANLGAGDFTLMAWIYKRSQGPAIVLAKGVGFGPANEWSWGWEWPIGAANLAFRCANRYFATAPRSVVDGRWIHVAFVRQGNQGHSYVNGEPSGGPHDLSGMGDLTNGKPLLIGRRAHDPSPAWFAGNLRDIRIYARALGPEGIRAAMAGR